jgi:hypothetical protein
VRFLGGSAVDVGGEVVAEGGDDGAGLFRDFRFRRVLVDSDD